MESGWPQKKSQGSPCVPFDELHYTIEWIKLLFMATAGGPLYT